MKNKLILPWMFVGVGVIACGGDGARRSGDQKAYETVQEGSAAGVTSTIQGPGETLPPSTATNADTTTAFTIDPNAATTGTAMPAPGTGSLAGTLPGSPAPGTYPMPAPPMTSASVPPAQAPAVAYPGRPRPQPVQPQPQPVEDPEPTDPSTTTAEPEQQQPPPVTSTTPAQKPPADEDDAEEEPPPPPTTTDTRGQ